jgi:hypothetical protein
MTQSKIYILGTKRLQYERKQGGNRQMACMQREEDIANMSEERATEDREMSKRSPYEFFVERGLPSLGVRRRDSEVTGSHEGHEQRM